MHKKSNTDRIFELGYLANDAKESQQNIDLLRSIHAKRFSTHEKLAKKVRATKAQPLQEAV